jgi:CIC family chloride channel protein
MGGGYGTIQAAILGQVTITLMAALVFLKMLTTSFTISSGGSGGVFGPTLFIGGMIGGVVGQVAHLYFPGVVVQPGAFVLVGMAAFFAGVANAPMGAMIMVCEMTGSYGLLAPLMLVSVIAILLSPKWSIYEKQVKNKFHSPAHVADMTVNVLKEIKVGQIFRPDAVVTALSGDMKFEALKDVISRTTESYFPVVDNQGRLAGILNLHDIRTVLFEDGLSDLVVGGELAGPPVSVRPGDDLFHACPVSSIPERTDSRAGRQRRADSGPAQSRRRHFRLSRGDTPAQRLPIAASSAFIIPLVFRNVMGYDGRNREDGFE